MADETKTILAIVVSLIAAVAGAVLFFVSIAKTSKGNLNIKTPSVTSSAGELARRGPVRTLQKVFWLWWKLRGLNPRPHPCEGYALPLS